MSALTQFKPNLTTGHLRYHIDDTKEISGYLKCDGSVALKSAYPKLTEYIDDIITNQSLTVTTVNAANSYVQINDLIYANGKYVYVGTEDAIGTSNDGTLWTNVSDKSLIYVGGKTAGRVGNTTPAVVSLTDLTGGVASAPAANDVVFVAVATGSTAQYSMAVTGYTQIASLYSNDSLDTNLWIGYRIMGLTPNTTITIPSSGSVNDAQTYAIQVWRNCNLNNLFDTTTTTINQIDTVLVNPPAITTLTKNAVLLVVGAGGHSQVTQTYTAPYLSNFLTSGADDTADSTIGFGSRKLAVPQTYDPAAWTFSGADSASFSCSSVTIALKPLSNNINSIVYANNNFVYVGDTGTISTSTNGTDWTKRTSGVTDDLFDIVYGNNIFVAAGNNGTILTSSNGITWTTRTSGTSNNITALTYGSNTFIAVGNSGTILTSSNGISWDLNNSLIRSDIPLTYVGGKTNGRAGALTSLNVSLTDLTGGVASAPAANDVVFVAVATGSTAQYSMAVTGYTQIASLYSNDSNDTNLWVGYRIMESTPNTTITIPASGSLTDGQTYAIQVWRNIDPNDLFDNTPTTATQTNTLLVNPPAITTQTTNTVLLVVGAGAHGASSNTYTASYLSNFLTSSADDTYDSTIGFGSISLSGTQTYDPAAWTFSGVDAAQYSCASATIALRKMNENNFNDIIYANNIFAIVGDRGLIYTSSDGITWTSRGSGITNGSHINTILYNDYDKFFAIGHNSGIRISNNLINPSWTSKTATGILSSIYDGKTVSFFGSNTGTVLSFSYYNYDANNEFYLPTSQNILDGNFSFLTPTAFIKYE